MEPGIPYQAYKSKRHSRTLSSPSNSPPPRARPASAIIAPAHLQVSNGDVAAASSNGISEQTPPPELVFEEPVAPEIIPKITVFSAPAVSSPTSPTLTMSVNGTASASAAIAPSSKITLDSNGSLLTSSPPPSPSASASSSTAPPSARKPSTFRRITPARTPLPSSPLRPASAQPSGVLQRPPDTRMSSALILSASPPRSLNHPPTHNRATSHDTAQSLLTTPTPAPPPQTISPTPSTSTSTSTPQIQTPAISPSPPPLAITKQAPYRPGFQPRGVISSLTDSFLTLRRTKRDIGRIERTKLERRLEKLIALHFPSSSSSTERPHMERRSSSIFDLDPGGIWRGLMMNQGQDIRAVEQRITPWQDDALVSKCPHCTTSFHPLMNRKHHCRLCGLIMCSLPVKLPLRPVPCSSLFVVDAHTRRIEQVKEGVDYGVKRRRTTSITPTPAEEEDKFLKGVRICKACRPVILRHQLHQELTHIPPFTKLYDAFISLESQIQDTLPQFQELVISLTTTTTTNDGDHHHHHPTTKVASSARKKLLHDFAQYDALAKRIRKLPHVPGSSQERVQMAITTRANLFLQKNMIPLQSLPTKHKPSSSSSSTKEAISEPATEGPGMDALTTTNTVSIDPDSETAKQLQPLLEQEALLESFVEEAMAHRKFEDVKTLKTNLKEIREEIGRIVSASAAADENGIGNGNGEGKQRNGRRKNTRT